MERNWRFAWLILAVSLFCGVAALSNTVDSATMVFEGFLTANPDGSYTGIVIMVDGAGESNAGAGDGEDGFDVYARNGAMATYDKAGSGSQDYACGRVVDHDAYTTAGGWGSYYNPDCADWYNYQLRFENGNWYLEYNANVGYDGDTSGAAAAPMSGVMDWTNMYAVETGAGAYYPGMGTAESAGYALNNPCTGVNNGEAAWDMDWSWGSEYIPLAFPGFEVTITDLGGGEYQVIMTPADGRDYGYDPPGPVVNETTGESYGTIQAAINDAQPGDTILVAEGTYDEQVIIDKDLAIQGAGNTTVIQPSQATADNFQLFSRKASANLPTAAIIVVDQAGVTSVTIKDLKVDGSLVNSVPAEATMFVGILWRGTGGTIDSVTVEGIGITNGNAIYITSYGKTVTTEVKECTISGFLKNGITANHAGLTANIHNNTVTGSGPTDAVAQNGIQVGFGATGSVVENTVSDIAYTGGGNEACGILFYDSSGTARDNTVTDCQSGIVAQASSSVTCDVTIENNTINTTGLAGLPYVAGIGAVTWNATATINVTVKNNDLTGPGYGEGVSIGSEWAAGTVNATIEGNDISNWGHGIWLGPTGSEIVITGNNIIDNVEADSGIHITGVDVLGINIHFNNIEGNTAYGVYNGGTGTLDATHNWWGDASGPYHSTLNPDGMGDEVSDNVDFDPWVGSEVSESATDTLGQGETVELPSGDASVTVTDATGTAEVTVAQYSDDPTGAGSGAGFGATDVGYIDVYVPDPANLNELEIRLYYPNTITGADESTLQLYWWNAGEFAWVPCSDQGVNTADVDGYGGYIWALIRDNTTPSLGDLSGAIFGGGGGLPASVFWYEDFEYADQDDMKAAGWIFSGNPENLWHLASEADVPALAYDNLTPFPSPDHAAWFGRDDTGDYDLGGMSPQAVSPEARARAARMRPMGAGQGYPYGELTSPEIELPIGVNAVRVGFAFYREVECYIQGSYDRTYVQVSFDGGPWQTVWSKDSTDCWLNKVWHPMYVDGIPVWGEDNWALVAVPPGAETMRIRFVFDAVDNVANDFLGWLIDDLTVATAGSDQLRIEPDSLPEGIVTQTYSATLWAVGGTGSYYWRILQKPDWLAVEEQDTQVNLSGTPNEPGTYQFCIGVSDDRGQSYERCYDIVVEQAITEGVLFYDDFETADGWTESGLWHLTDGSSWPQNVWPNIKPQPPYASPTHCYYYGKDETLNYATAGPNSGCLVSPAIDVSGLVAGTQLTVGWKYWRQVEYFTGGSYDQTYVEISFDGTNWSTIWFEDSTDPSEEDWLLVEVSAYLDGSPILVPSGATQLQIRFWFDTVDGYANHYVGWLIDDVKVVQQIVGPEPLVITTTCDDLPDGQVGDEYYAQLEATGGVPPYTWSWTCNGGIPGLDLDPDTGEITGIPTQAGQYCCEFAVTDAAGNKDTLNCCIDIAAPPPCPCDLLSEDFEDGAVGWTMTGLWHVTGGLQCIDCDELTGNFAYFGQDADCDYATGARVQGYLTSPVIPIDPCIEAVAIGFSFLREVESYSGAYDKTFVQVSWDGGPWQTIWYRDSKDPSPECDAAVLGPIPVPAGATTLQVRFGFDSVDKLYNNHRGWAVDDVWVKDANCVPGLGPVMLPLAVEPEAGPREPSFLAVPNPVRDVHTTTFYVRGVEADLIRVEVYDLSGRLVWQGEAPGNELVWHTEGLGGLPLANGVYLYRVYVKAGGDRITSDVLKIVILR